MHQQQKHNKQTNNADEMQTENRPKGGENYAEVGHDDQRNGSDPLAPWQCLNAALLLKQKYKNKQTQQQ